jgi:hypothetical protein
MKTVCLFALLALLNFPWLVSGSHSSQFSQEKWRQDYAEAIEIGTYGFRQPLPRRGGFGAQVAEHLAEAERMDQHLQRAASHARGKARQIQEHAQFGLRRLA